MTGESSTGESERTTPTERESTGETETASESESAEGNSAEADEGVTRRGFVRRAAGTVAAAGTAGIAATDEASAQAQTYRFGGEVAAWQGREPAAIEGQSNPTIELEAGQEYEFWFENIDGTPHNMTIQDANGNAIAQSELITSEGGTASVTFTATPQMTQYVCTIHSSTMVGDLNVTGQVEGGGGGGIPLRMLLLASAVGLAFISPILFAVLLFSQGDDRTTETPAGPQ